MPRLLRLVAVALLAASSASACTKYYGVPADGSATAPTIVPTPTPHTIEYRVLGTVALADVTFGSAQDGTTFVETTLPWASSVKTTRATLFVYLKAESPFAGRVQVQIFVDGQLFREASNDNLSATNVAETSGTVDFTQ